MRISKSSARHRWIPNLSPLPERCNVLECYFCEFFDQDTLSRHIGFRRKKEKRKDNSATVPILSRELGCGSYIVEDNLWRFGARSRNMKTPCQSYVAQSESRRCGWKLEMP